MYFWYMSYLLIIFKVYLSGRQRKIAEYYKKQVKLLKGFDEVDSFAELGILPGTLTEVISVLY